MGRRRKMTRLTLEESISKVDARISIPFRPPILLDHERYVHGSELFDLNQQPILRPEANNDLWDTKKERLDPKLHELTLKVASLTVALDHCRRLELHPVDGIALGFRLVIPY